MGTALMTRTLPQALIDDLAFPVGVKIAAAPSGLGRQTDELQVWLQPEPPGPHAGHSAPTIGGSAMGNYHCSAANAI